MSASNITPSASFQLRSPAKLMLRTPKPMDASFNRRYLNKTIPGTLDLFDEEMEPNPQKPPEDKKEADNKQTDSPYTPYMNILKEANEAPAWDNLRAALFSWLTLAGYVVFPGAFTSLKNSQALVASSSGKIIQDTIKNTPFQVIAGLCCFFGMAGTSWLWYIWRNNIIWLIKHVFLPGLAHSLIGLITTLINVYTAQGGHWSVTAKVTVIVIGICTGNMSVLYLVYNHWVLEKVKTPLDKEPARRRHT
ncbi:hypothetical protein F5884DRAFT_905171 [Xylogone sp. PMI_703]|nr:hypothetical protein F5884DRAFT_905171 [Xylogone sp. PMI_703]